MQGTWVRALVREDPTTAEPACHSGGRPSETGSRRCDALVLSLGVLWASAWSPPALVGRPYARRRAEATHSPGWQPRLGEPRGRGHAQCTHMKPGTALVVFPPLGPIAVAALGHAPVAMARAWDSEIVAPVGWSGRDGGRGSVSPTRENWAELRRGSGVPGFGAGLKRGFFDCNAKQRPAEGGVVICWDLVGSCP